MTNSSLANLPSPPSEGSIQFFDGYYPSLMANTYTITLTHTLKPATEAAAPSPSFTAKQVVILQAPQFSIDPGIVASVYPPKGASDTYKEKLPFIILSDPSLPWERGIFPNQGEPNHANPTSWMALVILAESEVRMPQNSSNPVITMAVSELLAPDTNKAVLKPQLVHPTEEVLASQCQTITIPGLVFQAVMPTLEDLPFLSHCRGVNTLDEGEKLLSVLLANRLPQPASSPTAPVRYFAHLVSLEGFGPYLGPNPTAIPTQPNSTQLMDIQLVSLYSWSFTSLPESGESFCQLMNGLVASQQATSSQQSTVALQLPLPASTNVPQNVQDRLNQGFVPLQFNTGSGEESFAWYRGPLTAQVPQQLPPVGNPGRPVYAANTADALMIYLAEQGLFDMSYAAAWNLGRNLALADAVFARNITLYRRAVASTFSSLAQRLSMQHFGVGASPDDLLANNATRQRFTSMMASGLGNNWTTTLMAARRRGGETTAAVGLDADLIGRPQRRFATRPAVHPALLTSAPEAVAAVSTDLSEIIESITAWLARLSLLYPVPFSHLVPDPRMLPVESIRFFYLDPGWIDALLAGALSIAMHSSGDVQQQLAMLPTLLSSINGHRVRSFARNRPDTAPNPGNTVGNTNGGVDSSNNAVAITGVVIRSSLISGWPKLIISGTVGGVPLNTIRDDCLSSSVRICFFDGIPDTITLSEPYQGLLFGVESTGVYPRCVTAPSFIGTQFANSPVSTILRPTPADGLGGIVHVKKMAEKLEDAVGVTPFANGAQVNWNGTPLATTFVSANQLQATVPANLVVSAGSAAITVTSNGATSQPRNFTINAPLEIDTINPAMIEVGANDFTLSVAGVGFASYPVVYWNNTPLTTKTISANLITAQVPADRVAGPATAAITVHAGDRVSNSVNFDVVTADPLLNSLQPNLVMQGSTGFTLIVNGSGFAAGAVVEWNHAPLATALISGQQLKAMVPASLVKAQGTAQVAVGLDGVMSNSLSFTITNSSPTIGSLSPSVVLAGAHSVTLTIDGVNFANNSTINWGGYKINNPDMQGAERISVLIPDQLLSTAGLVNVMVQADGVSSNAVPFLVIAPQPSVGLLDPPEVIAGGSEFTLNVYGGFGAGDFALQMVAAPEMQSFPST